MLSVCLYGKWQQASLHPSIQTPVESRWTTNMRSHATRSCGGYGADALPCISAFTTTAVLQSSPSAPGTGRPSLCKQPQRLFWQRGKTTGQRLSWRLMRSLGFWEETESCGFSWCPLLQNNVASVYMLAQIFPKDNSGHVFNVLGPDAQKCSFIYFSFLLCRLFSSKGFFWCCPQLRL